MARTTENTWREVEFVTSNKCKWDEPQCVGVGNTEGFIGVIDTKRPENDRPVLSFTDNNWRTFLGRITG